MEITTNKNWVFGTDGQLTVPGAIFRDGSLYMNSGGSTTSASVIALGNAGSVILRTSNQSTNHDLTFDVDGTLTLPGILEFPDGSTYDNSTLTGAVDSDLALEVKHIATASAIAAAGSTTGTLIINISEDDDITVVAPEWEINAGTEIAPIWMAVTEITVDPQNTTFEITVPEFVFEPGNEYTFRNPVPESKSWTIRSQTGAILGPSGVIITNETAPLGGGNTYRELAFELPAQGALSNEQRWVFANNGNLTLPQYNQIASVGSNATITLNGVGSNESILELATHITGEQIASNFYMAPGGFGFNSVRNIDIHAGYDNATAKRDAWVSAEALWTEIRDQDAATIAPEIRLWDGLTSYQSYDALMAYLQDPPLGDIPPPSGMASVANTAKAAYELWQAEQAAINVTVSAKDKTWTFGNNGSLTLPNGSVIKDKDNSALSFGYGAGTTNQGASSIAIGLAVGETNQGNASIAIGVQTAIDQQGFSSVAIGALTGSYSQGSYTIAIGRYAGHNSQGTYGIALGHEAGKTSQGAQAIAIGNSAGYLNQHANSIILNASGSTLNSDGTSRFYVDPIRSDATPSNVLFYNTTSKEVTYGANPKTQGTFTLGLGTNGITITLDVNATYTMWLRAVVDNGVISYNATVTITNANLPVLGQQQAYAYTGAGTPLDWVSLPTQIINTAGGVIRNSTLIGPLPANVFDFVIQNDSEQEVELQYGYTKI